MGNQSKPSNCRPRPKTEVWLDETERQRPNLAPPRGPRPRTIPWVTQPILRTRGWTDTAIQRFLPEPESYRRNPYRRGRNRPMPLWRPETVARVEATPKWQAWLEESLHRRKMSPRDLKPNPGLARHYQRAQSAIDRLLRDRR